MSKMLLAMVASLATLVATTGAAKAAFTVTLLVNGVPIGGANPFGPITLTGSGANSSYNATLLSSGPSNNNGVSRSIGTDSIESQPVFSTLSTNSILLRNRTGSAINTLTVVVSQNSYVFPANPVFFTNSATLDVALGTISGGSFTVSATNQATQAYTFGAFGGTVGSTVGAVGGSGPYTITQTFVLNNVSNGAIVQFTEAVSSITTPLPATGLMAAVGFPLLGLAGAFRRRVLG